MQLSPDQLIALLRARGIRVEVEELLRLHEALQHGTDWTPQRLENVIVGILATCPEDPPRIRESIRELRHALDPALAPAGTAKGRVLSPRKVGPPPLVSRRLVVSLGLGGVAAAAGTVALLSRRREPEGPAQPAEPATSSSPESASTGTSTPATEPRTPPTGPTGSVHESKAAAPEASASAGPPEPTSTPTPATVQDPADTAEPQKPEPTSEPEAPPEPAEAPWITKERDKQEAYRATQTARREQEKHAREQAIAAIDATRTSRRVVVPRFVPRQTSWRRLVGAALLGPAVATGAIAWFAHRAWRRRSREAQRFGGSALEIAPGPSLFWLAPRERRWPPLLGVEAREALVWGVGQIESDEQTRVLDAAATIDATIAQGGLPELRFHNKRRLRRVWLWHDQSAAGPIGARLCAEVQQTLHSYGLAVEVGRFRGLPERIERDDGRLTSLDALDEERELSTVIVLTDGSELLRLWEWRDETGRSRQPQVRALLGRLAGWPHLAIVHTGTRERMRALRALLDPFGIPCLPIEAFPLAVREREHLARTVGTFVSAENVWMWAALCALYPLPVPEAQALALLRQLDLPISPLSLGQLMDQSVTTTGIQFKPQARARLIERLRRAVGDGDGALPAVMKRALAFWRAQTIADDPDWESDSTGRGLHRRLVVALLDVWTDPERAARELSALWKSPHMPAIREELGRMRPAGKRPGAPEPGTFHVPLDPATLDPTTRARLQAAGMGALAVPEGGGARVQWPWWLRGLVVLTVLLFIASAALLAVDGSRESGPVVDDSFPWALARSDTGDRLHAHVAGEWRDVGAWPIAEDAEVVTEGVEVTCPAADRGVRRCLGAEGTEEVPARRIAVLDAESDAVDAVRFADSLLDRGLVDAAWIGAWPPWMENHRVRAIEGRRGLDVWVFTLDPEFVPDGTGSGERADESDLMLVSLRDWADAPSSRVRVHRSTDWGHLLATFPAEEPAAPPVTDVTEVAFAEVPQDPGALLVTGVPGRVTAAAGRDGGLLVGTSSGELYWSKGKVTVKDESAHERPIVALASALAATLSVEDAGSGRLWLAGESNSRALSIDPIKLHVVSLDRKGLVVATTAGQVLTIDGSAGDAAPAREPEPVSGQTWETVVDGLVSRSREHVALISGGAIHVCERSGAWACRKHKLELDPQLLAVSPLDGAIAVASKGDVPTIGVLGAEVGGTGMTPLKSQFKGPLGRAVGLRYSPDGKYLAVASEDGTVWVAKTDGGEGCPRVLRHETELADFAFSADGSLLATASGDGDVRVFRAEDGAGPVRLAGHRGALRSVSFLPDEAERRILSVSEDGSARVWAAPGAEAFAGAEAAESLCVADLPAPTCKLHEELRERVCVKRCPAGMSFIAGTGPDGFVSGENKKQVVKDVCMDITEVTVAAFARCAETDKCEPASTKTKLGSGTEQESEDCNANRPDRQNHPVNCVDLAQAKAYCAAQGKRLPTEWEWEWAARGRDEGRTYPWGNEEPSCGRAVMSGSGGDGCGKNRTWPVGSKPTGNSRDGLKDMAGNVLEWTSNPYSADYTVTHGGSLYDNDPIAFLVVYRRGLAPADRRDNLGFRCARTAGPPEGQIVEPVPPSPEPEKPAPAVCKASAADNACRKCAKSKCCSEILRCENVSYIDCKTRIDRFDFCGSPPSGCEDLTACITAKNCDSKCYEQ